jgi:sec-independent protein translocase protein TatA
MLGLGFQEIIVILVIGLVLFGSSKLPEMGKALGKSIREFKKAYQGEDEKPSLENREDGKKGA